MDKYLREQLTDLDTYGAHYAIERFVCARRARKLRRRGERVRYAHFVTTTGRPRYLWLMRIPPSKLRR